MKSRESGPILSPFKHITLKEFRDELEIARGLTPMTTGMLQIAHESRRRDSTRLADIYHHAGFLYSYHCLYFLNPESVAVEYSNIRLLEALDNLEDTSTWIQKFPWPVFILETEYHEDISRQTSLRQMYQNVIGNIGFNHYSLVLQFLEEFCLVWG